MRLAVGCPVARRDWVLPVWFDHVEVACRDAGVDPVYVFVVHRDDPCWDLIEKRASLPVMVEPSKLRSSDQREWSPKRYVEMVALRNQLLAAVRSEQPDAFLSLDSDILLAPAAITELVSHLGDVDAVGGKCFMTAMGTTCPSYAHLGRNGQLVRSDAQGFFPVDVIMAVKLMSPAAYAVDYEFHLQGEDIGWSLAARRSGLQLAWSGRVCSKHLLQRSMLDRVDPRCGF